MYFKSYRHSTSYLIKHAFLLVLDYICPDLRSVMQIRPTMYFSIVRSFPADDMMAAHRCTDIQKRAWGSCATFEDRTSDRPHGVQGYNHHDIMICILTRWIMYLVLSLVSMAITQSKLIKNHFFVSHSKSSWRGLGSTLQKHHTSWCSLQLYCLSPCLQWCTCGNMHSGSN